MNPNLITMMLMEATPDPKFFWEFVLSIGLLVAIGANVVTIMAFKRTQKREVHFGFEPASKMEFEKLAALNLREHENLFKKIGGVERGAAGQVEREIKALREERQADMRGLHQEINEVGKKVAGLDTETKNQNAWLSRMDGKLDDLTKRP